MQNLLERKDIITMFRVGKVTLLKWEKEGLKSYPVGRKIYYELADVERFIKEAK